MSIFLNPMQVGNEGQKENTNGRIRRFCQTKLTWQRSQTEKLTTIILLLNLIQKSLGDFGTGRISPGCVEVMRRRGVEKSYHRNILDPRISRYDTVLMLMNGIGICGSLDGLNLFIQHLDTVLAPSGQLLADSTDLTGKFLENDEAVYDEEGEYCGETDFVMIYKGLRSDPFSWFYVDFELLHTICSFNGFRCDKLIETKGKQFLASVYRSIERG